MLLKNGGFIKIEKLEVYENRETGGLIKTEKHTDLDYFVKKWRFYKNRETRSLKTETNRSQLFC